MPRCDPENLLRLFIGVYRFYAAYALMALAAEVVENIGKDGG
jgi:hypothetical protein